VEAAAPAVSGRYALSVSVSAPAARSLREGDRVQIVLRDRAQQARVGSLTPGGNDTLVLNLQLAESGLRARVGDFVDILTSKRVDSAGFWMPVSALAEGVQGLWSCLVAAPIEPGRSSEAATHRLERREVEIVHLEKDRVFVRGTVQPGELVVIQGLHILVPGLSVRAVELGRSAAQT
jgi:hypothetical protein